jgi:hypothetical protein
MRDNVKEFRDWLADYCYRRAQKSDFVWFLSAFERANTIKCAADSLHDFSHQLPALASSSDEKRDAPGRALASSNLVILRLFIIIGRVRLSPWTTAGATIGRNMCPEKVRQ